jgi:hypothetical protein
MAGDLPEEGHKVVAGPLKARSRAAADVGPSLTVPQDEVSHISTRDTPLGRSLPQEGSKQALIIAMLQKTKGASIEALMAATGWLPHTTRAALTGLRKRGFKIELTKKAAGSVYHIISQSKAAA